MLCGLLAPFNNHLASLILLPSECENDVRVLSSGQRSKKNVGQMASQLGEPQVNGRAEPEQKKHRETSEARYLAPPAETRVLPVQICDSLVVQPSKLGIDVLFVALAVVPLHVEHQSYAQDQNSGRGGEVQAIADRVIGCVVWHESPRGDQTADVACVLLA